MKKKSRLQRSGEKHPLSLHNPEIWKEAALMKKEPHLQQCAEQNAHSLDESEIWKAFPRRHLVDEGYASPNSIAGAEVWRQLRAGSR
jgi:hypothetical protein